ncbi:hypothetical protein AURDEDRAFT_175011 [Auricularia subglabra TFB-10046 SS5]|nr:hypothetical protein AURDEDRAFT_175011 [Auricularia subglabra TFB-10046 SS5]
MSTLKPTHFLVVAYDAPAGESDRITHLEEHLAGVAPLGPALVFGGAIFSDDGSKMIGSSFCVKADSLDAAREIVERDAYYVNGVWDKERIIIAPFFKAA